MIKLKVTSREFDDDVRTKVEGEVSGKRSVLVTEVAHLLLELARLEKDILTDAMGLMLDKLIEESKDDE